MGRQRTVYGDEKRENVSWRRNVWVKSSNGEYERE